MAITNPTTNPTPPSSDPSVYQANFNAFAAEGQPKTSTAWLDRARKVSDILAPDAAARSKEQKIPRAEVALLKNAGLLKALGDIKYGGGGQSWEIGYKIIREVAAGDGSIGMLLGYHLLWSTTARIVGTKEQQERTEKLILENNYFIGGAVNPRDNDSRVTQAPSGDGLVFNGFKNFNTGGVISDLTVLEGVYENTDGHIFALVQTNQPGIIFSHNWNNIGLRLTESGSVKIDNVPIPWEDALGWSKETKAPIPEVLGIQFPTLLLPTIQLVFVNFYIGIAQGALRTARLYTATQTRPWPFAHDPKQSAADEHYVLARYGKFFASLRAADALADRAGQELAALYGDHGDKRDITARQRGEVAEWVVSVKIVATHTALDVTSGVFEVTGARSTAEKYGLDRFWRDVRTHTLHDPVAYKESEQGRFFLLDEIPSPTWYT
ncbi:thermophilic desulfurizing enzyme family protein [Aspergillus candidus]|uniref:Thermophilic desulfurizing enzyme family protein n=1 Tax=Aspergillus candidus TaxID=41067 RepID=A0A2I2FLD5_ASPCN|nr:thermophilic desulfurizing enzyme family protein [Aspergillus candidus]PLB41414.1 thermophilic desulfurizing enzyme family protein [Aspergillus candidus]